MPGPPSPPALPPGRAGNIQRWGGEGSFAVDPLRIGLGRGGTILPQALLAKMEAAFGADFSAVRVHVGPQAARIGALAFTTGDNLYFAPGQYQPDSVRGQQLIGHELAHVVQQRQGRVRAPGNGMFVVQDQRLEAEADRLGMRAAAHRGAAQTKPLPGGGRVALQRHPAPFAPQGKWAGAGQHIQRSSASTDEKKSTPAKRASTRKPTALTAIQMDKITAACGEIWKARTSAGTQNTSLAFAASTSTHSCAARGTANGHPYTGNFNSDGKHAEMDLITNIYAGEHSLANVTSIEIEKEPCPRCAVVLRCLGLNGVVTYKNSGQKDYPTWRAPELGPISWEEMLGIEAADYPAEVVTALLGYFATNKFW